MAHYVRLAVPLDITGIRGLKMTPQSKPGTAAGRLQTSQSSSTRSHRKKLLSAGFPDKAGRRSSTRLKRRYSKSASGGNRQSQDKSTYGFLTSAHIASRERAPSQIIKTDKFGDPNSVDREENIVIVTDAHPKHLTLDNQLPDSTLGKDTGQNNCIEEEKSGVLGTLKMSLSSELSTTLESINEEDAARFEQENRTETKSNKAKEYDMVEIERLLMKCRGMSEVIADSDDDDDFVFPNLLGYDFHAIYKKDGLQFDENWQNRMLDRYMLMKLQKQQRQESATIKRVFLEQEKRSRFITAQPDLVQKLEQPWYEDHEALASYLLKNSLISGDSSFAPQDTLPSHSTSSSRSLSSRSNLQKGGTDEGAEKDGKFRFSIRPKSSQTHASDTAKSFDPSSPRAASAKNARLSRSRSVGNISSEKLLVDRPRSSTSIPGKTRYILIKPDKDKKLRNIRNPTKLEEQLLLKRFPSQHSSVMKSLGRSDRLESSDVLEDENEQEISFHEMAGRPVSSHVDRKSYADHDGRSELVDRSESPSFPKQGERSLTLSNGWKSPFSDGYINPMDIVKRKSIEDNRRTIEIHLRSLNA